MKLKDIPLGGKFRFSQYPAGGVYVKGSRIESATEERYYVHSGNTVYANGGEADTEVIRVEDADEIKQEVKAVITLMDEAAMTEDRIQYLNTEELKAFITEVYHKLNNIIR